MLSRRRGVVFAVAIITLVALIAGGLLFLKRPPRAAHAEPDLPAKPQAPPDLARHRDAFAAGLAALSRKDGADAVKHFSSIDFGSRAVEEYRLFHLAQAYELAKNPTAQRRVLMQLWQRKPALVQGPQAALTLTSLHAEHGSPVAADIAASAATRTIDSNVAGEARWIAAEQRFLRGDISGALYAARNLAIKNPRAKQADEALAFVRALTGVAEGEAVRLDPDERLERAVSLLRDGDPKQAEQELAALEPAAPPALRMTVQLNRGLALHRMGRFEDSIKVLEPLTSGPFKYSIPALYFASRNYRTVSASIDPTVYKTIVEKKKVGTVKVRVGKGKKRRTVTKPKFANVKKQIKLIDLAKKNKKDEYDRLASERLKDLLSLPLSKPVHAEVLGALIERASAKNQDEYLRELVPQLVKIDRNADPALQHFWDKGWAAYTRGDLGTAKSHFRFIADTYENVNVRRQSEYWYARSVERQGQKEEAAAIYRKLASAPYVDLYAQHAIRRGAKRSTPPAANANRTDWQELAEKEMPADLRLAYELTALSAVQDARLEVQRNMNHANRRFASALLADLHYTSGEMLPMYRVIRDAWPQLATVEQDSVPPYFMKLYYPMKYHDAIREHAKANGLPPHLVMALILQESYYNPRAKSRVGATGLMQLMPPTARELAGQLGLRYSSGRLEDPEYNVRLGTRHLRMLVNLFRGETHLAVASYNAGQGNVLKWRRGAPRKPIDEFLESIPFDETRNYVKRVTMLRSSYERLAP